MSGGNLSEHSNHGISVYIYTRIKINAKIEDVGLKEDKK